MPSPLFRRFFGATSNAGRNAAKPPSTPRDRGNLVRGVANAIGSAIGKAFGRAIAKSVEPAIEDAVRQEWPENVDQVARPEQTRQNRSQATRRVDAWEDQDIEYLPQIEGPIEVRSSNVHSIAYEYSPDGTSPGNLLVRYLGGDSKNRTGEGPLYRYKDVPVQLWREFKAAASKGKFIWSELRVRGTISGHQYAYELAGTGDDNYVPRQAGLKRGKHGEWYLNRRFGDLESSLPERAVRRGRTGDLTQDFGRRAREDIQLRAGRRK